MHENYRGSSAPLLPKKEGLRHPGPPRKHQLRTSYTSLAQSPGFDSVLSKYGISYNFVVRHVRIWQRSSQSEDLPHQYPKRPHIRFNRELAVVCFCSHPVYRKYQLTSYAIIGRLVKIAAHSKISYFSNKLSAHKTVTSCQSTMNEFFAGQILHTTCCDIYNNTGVIIESKGGIWAELLLARNSFKSLFCM